MKHLARTCPMCQSSWGVVIEEPDGNIRAVHGLCGNCGYGIIWAVISSDGAPVVRNDATGRKLQIRRLFN